MQDHSGIKNNNETTPAAGNIFISRLLHYAKNGILVYWSSFFILILIEFFLGGQLSKILTSNNYSVYIIVLNTLPFYSVLVNIGFAYSIIYFISYNSATRYSLLRKTFQLNTAWYLLLVAVHFVIFFLFRGIYLEALLITILIAYTYSYKLNLTSFFLASGGYTKAAISNTLQKITLVVVFTLVFYSAGLQQILNVKFPAAYPAIELSAVLLYFVFFWKTNITALSAQNINYGKRLIQYGKYAMFNNCLNLLYYTIIALIIRSAHIALHIQIILGLCILFFRYTAVAIAPLFSTMSPQLTRIKNDTAAVQKMYKKYFVIISAMSLFILLGCRFFFSFIIIHFYAAAYRDLPEFFNFFCYLIPLLFLNSYNSSAMAALGKIKFATWAELICTLLLVLFFVYNLLSPITGYHVFYYMVLIHLAVKFLILGFGVLKTIKK